MAETETLRDTRLSEQLNGENKERGLTHQEDDERDETPYHDRQADSINNSPGRSKCVIRNPHEHAVLYHAQPR